jgi:hypothetical protein
MFFINLDAGYAMGPEDSNPDPSDQPTGSGNNIGKKRNLSINDLISVNSSSKKRCLSINDLINSGTSSPRSPESTTEVPIENPQPSGSNSKMPLPAKFVDLPSADSLPMKKGVLMQVLHDNFGKRLSSTGFSMRPKVKNEITQTLEKLSKTDYLFYATKGKSATMIDQLFLDKVNNAYNNFYK